VVVVVASSGGGRRGGERVFFIIFFRNVCRVFFYRRTAKAVTRRLVRAPSVAFLCRAPPHDARQRKVTVRCQTGCMAMRVYRANFCRVLFVVRPDEKRTRRLCRAFSGLCRAPWAHGKPPVSRSDTQSLFCQNKYIFIFMDLLFFFTQKLNMKNQKKEKNIWNKYNLISEPQGLEETRLPLCY
jgi:hypothetical protein